MKATGIVRRVDDLGRVFIPKEIRRRLGIREGDPMELYMDGSSLILKKYDPMTNAKDAIKQAKDRIQLDDELTDRVIASVIEKLSEAEKLLDKEDVL